MGPLAFLNLGPTEIALLLVLFLALFGADRIPQMMRSLGRAKAEFDRAQREVGKALKTEDERQLDEQLAFERLREQQIASQVEDPEREALARAAEQLGIPSAGRTADELRVALQARLGGGADAGANKDGENAANAQQ